MAQQRHAVSQETGLLEKTWERIQKKTFTAWINSHLAKVGLKIEEITTDLSDGLKLIRLLEVLSGDTITGYEKNPGLRIKKVVNVGIALKFVESHGVKLVGIGPEEVVDGNLKIILGMIWTIILRFQIQDISEEELSAREALLLWVQKKTKGYRDVNVQNFHLSFQDGLAFCALIHKHRPDLIDYDSLRKENKAYNLQLAFDVAEKHLGIAKILDVNDIVNIPKPDERSIMTYVASMYHVFASSRKAETAAKNVANVIDFTQANEKIMNTYEERAKALAGWIQKSTDQLNQRDFANHLEGLLQQIQTFNDWKAKEKPPKATEKTEIETLFNNLQTKLRLNKRSPYRPPPGLAPQDIDALWAALNKAENERGIALRNELKRLKHLSALVERFKVKALALEQFINAKYQFMDTDDLGDSVAAVEAKLKNHEAFEEDYALQQQKLQHLDQLKDEIVAGKHKDAPWCEQRFQELTNKFEELRHRADKRKADLLAELERQKKIQEMLVTYAKTATAFARWAEDAEDLLNDPWAVSRVEEVQELQRQLEEFVAQTSGAAANVKTLQELAQTIRNSGNKENTYSEYTIDAINAKWQRIEELIERRKGLLAQELAKQNEHEQLRLEWAKSAGAFVNWIDAEEAKLNTKAAEVDKNKLEEEIETIKAVVAEIKQHQNALDALVTLNQRIEAAEITENPHTDLTLETAKMKWDKLIRLGENTVQLLEGELIARKHGAVSPEELNEFKECFNHFDKDHDQFLTKLELKSCLQALGQDPTDAEVDNVLNTLGQTNPQGNRGLNFDQFVSYMKKKHSSSDTAESIKDAFKIIAGEKEYVTEKDLAAVLPPEKVAYLVARMPPYPGADPSIKAYDYKAYTDKIYS
jgi:actinin alpha